MHKRFILSIVGVLELPDKRDGCRTSGQSERRTRSICELDREARMANRPHLTDLANIPARLVKALPNDPCVKINSFNN